MTSAPKDIEMLLFGHIGDGNLHINYVGSKDIPKEKFQSTAREIEERVFAKIPKYRGSVSAEHGIGLLKKKDLLSSRSEAEVAIMKQFKRTVDPLGIMNPGKIFDL